MSERDNKRIVRRFSEGVTSKGDMKTIDETVAVDYVNHNPIPGQQPGREGLKQSIANLRRAFPDLQETIEEMIGEGDEVAVVATWRGTHLGPFLGVPASNRPIVIPTTYIARLADGMITDVWLSWNLLSLMEQIGAAPMPEGRREEMGDFARGERELPQPHVHPDFARGERQTPETEVGPDFARGEREAPRPETGPDFARGERTSPDDEGPTPRR